MAATEELTLRPVRPADYDRIVELTKDVWDGRDYISRVFDQWIADSAASFQAAEIDGIVIGVQRIRPFAPGLAWYEGLRVASSHRRQGIARAMLDSAIAEFRDQGFREMRLATLDPPAIHLFESAGFHELVQVRWWRAGRIEGGEPSRMPDAAEAKRLWTFVSSSPGIELYGGISPDLNGARDLDATELERLARTGMLRVGANGRAVALMREPWRVNLAVALIAGRGGAMQDLLMALRFEADADGADHVTVNVPPGHPAEEDLRLSGYDFDGAERNAHVYALKL